jgi:L-lactate dehydrogenase (cytochrome)
VKLERITSYADWRALARVRLPHLLFEYIDGGSYAEQTIRANADDLARLTIDQRVLTGHGEPSLATAVAGQKLAMPLLIAPVGFQGMFARRGEVQGARAAAKAGVPYCLSTLAICAIEEVAAAAPPPWFQLYVTRDRGFVRDMVARAHAAGCPALLLTVDLPVAGARYRDWRSGFSVPHGWAGRVREALDAGRRLGWMAQVYFGGRPHSFGNLSGVLPPQASFADAWGWTQANFDPTIGWRDLEAVRAAWNGPLLVKGVLHPDDAREAMRCGADGIVVSNHGGRQLDGAPSTISALPAIADAVGSDLELLLDGGVRSGLDVLKALQLGARAVLIGKLYAFALAAAGEAGVARMLSILRAELRTAMILAGEPDAASCPKRRN